MRDAALMATFISRLEDPARARATTGRGDGPIRVAVKDVIDLAGLPTTAGSKAIAALAASATADAACLRGLRAAEAHDRAVIVGKTNLHELAFGITGINPWYGTPVNPVDPRRVPGGSSSGSAVAVGAGKADVAIGTDTGGSVRIPAACCGVAGLKTTRGRIPTEGVRALAPSFDTVGPLAVDVRGLAAGMALLEPGFTVAETGAATRIGRFRPPSQPHVDTAVDDALARYGAATGARIEDIDVPDWDAATTSTMTILSAEAWQVFGELWRDHREDLSPDVARRLELASIIDPEEVAAAWEQARDWAARIKEAFEHVDAIALPVLGDDPPLIEDAASMAAIRHTAPWNLAGIPALAVPLPRPGHHMPPSLQLVGRAGSEEMLLATGLIVERSRPGPGTGA